MADVARRDLRHADGTDDTAIRRAALITLRRALRKRFPPGAQREFGWDGSRSCARYKRLKGTPAPSELRCVYSVIPHLAALLRLRLRHHVGVAILRRPGARRKGLHRAPSAFRQDDRARSVDVARRSGVKHERVGGIQAVAGSGKTSVEPLGVAPLNPQAALAVSQPVAISARWTEGAATRVPEASFMAGAWW